MKNNFTRTLESEKERFEKDFPTNQMGGFDVIYRDGGRRHREMVIKRFTSFAHAIKASVIADVEEEMDEMIKSIEREIGEDNLLKDMTLSILPEIFLHLKKSLKETK